MNSASLSGLSRQRVTPRSLPSALTLVSLALVQALPAQVPANYQGPTLYAVCAYVQNDTTYYSNIFSASGYYKFKAQEAFRQYALAQAKGAPLRGSACRWSTSKDDITTQKEADKRLLGLANHSAKGAETGWTFVPVASDAPTTTAVTATPTATANTAATNPRTARAANTGAATSTQATATPAASNASTAPAAQSGSIVGGAQQSASGALADSKTAASTSINQGVASSITAVSQGASSAIQGLFHRKSSDPKPDAQAATKTAVATPQNAAPMGFTNTETPLAATAEARHIEGIVADVANNELVINVGLQAGVQIGMKLAVMHAVRTVKDPATGKVLRTIENRVGDLTITSADAGSAEGTFAGTTKPAVGDTVRTPVQ